MRELTYPKRHVSTKEPSLVPRQEASKGCCKARRRSSAPPIQPLSPALRRLSNIYRFRVFFYLSPIPQRKRGTNCVSRRQKPTLLMASATTCSSAASRLGASIGGLAACCVPPSAARSLSTDHELIIRVAHGGTRGYISVSVSQPMMSTGAGNRERISLMRVVRFPVAHRCGMRLLWRRGRVGTTMFKFALMVVLPCHFPFLSRWRTLYHLHQWRERKMVPTLTTQES